jgi:triacylglycerol lipase
MRLGIWGALFGLASMIGCADVTSEESTASSEATVMAAPAPSTSADPDAPYPVVLMHGMAGFGQLKLGPVGITYFDGIVETLTKHGEAVYVTLAPPYASSEVRARAVATQIDQILARTGKRKVNLIGHSQGGLDARVLASPRGLGYGDRIASVTTVATPHRGSRVADLVLGLIEWLPKELVDDVTGAVLSILQKSVYELQTDPNLRAQLVNLSEKHMREVFNPKYVNDSRVAYKSYAGRSNLRSGLFACEGAARGNNPFTLDAAQPALAPLALFLEEGLELKVNDGLVTVDSAKWGTFEECVAADHLKEVGHLAPFSAFDHVELFEKIVSRIRQDGF